jgi:hypothetical protein
MTGICYLFVIAVYTVRARIHMYNYIFVDIYIYRNTSHIIQLKSMNTTKAVANTINLDIYYLLCIK